MMKMYSRTDRRLHWLCQVIAKANRTYLPGQEDDSHTNLSYDPVGNRICGRWINAPAGRFLLALGLSDLHFEWLDDRLTRKKIVGALNKGRSQLEEDVACFFAMAGLDTDLFFPPLHFEIPDYGFEESGVAAISTAEMGQWTFFRGLAKAGCQALSVFLQAPGEPRIWPHHFDTGIYTPAHEGLGIGFGLAMEDPMVGQPYFYLAGYPDKGAIEYMRLPELSVGRWQIDSPWKGAVFPLQNLPAGRPAADSALHTFIFEAVSWYLGKR